MKDTHTQGRSKLEMTTKAPDSHDTQGVWRDGQYMVVHALSRFGARSPEWNLHGCTNQRKVKVSYRQEGRLIGALLPWGFGYLFTASMNINRQDSIKLELPRVPSRQNRQRLLGTLICIPAVLLALALTLYLFYFSSPAPAYEASFEQINEQITCMLLKLLYIIPMVWLIYGLLYTFDVGKVSSPLHLVEQSDEYYWIKGAHADFLEMLPEYQPSNQ